MDNVYLLEKLELELWDLIERKHASLTYWDTLRVFIDIVQKLFIKSSVEYLEKGGK